MRLLYDVFSKKIIKTLSNCIDVEEKLKIIETILKKINSDYII